MYLLLIISTLLKDRLKPLRKEESPLPTWIQDNVDSSSRGVGAAFFLFGIYIDLSKGLAKVV